MPPTLVVFYAEANVAPFLGWLDALERRKRFAADPAAHTYTED